MLQFPSKLLPSVTICLPLLTLRALACACFVFIQCIHSCMQMFVDVPIAVAPVPIELTLDQLPISILKFGNVLYLIQAS